MDTTHLPSITQHCGLLTEPVEARHFPQLLPAIQPFPEAPGWDPSDTDNTYVDRWRVAYTDGSAQGASMAHRWRRAGYGVAWGRSRPQNFGGPLRGRWQSSQRAELTAALHAMHTQRQGPLPIRTDSAWTLAGAVTLLAGHPADFRWEHSDLWRAMKAAIEERPNHAPVAFQKVKAHAKAEHIAAGLITADEAEGNDRADKLAEEGRLMHHCMQQQWPITGHESAIKPRC